MTDPQRMEPGTAARKGAWSTRALEAKLALVLVVPLLAGAIAASFLPWPNVRLPLVFEGAVLAASIAAWAWLRATLVRRLRVLEGALRSGRLADLAAMPARTGWGELKGLADQVEGYLARQDGLVRDARELAAVRDAVDLLADTARAWAEDERIPDWGAALARTPGTLTPLVESLALASLRLDERLAEVRAVSGLVRETVDEAIARTGAAATTAERQFVEATSLLTVLRELKRWTAEVAAAVEALGQAVTTPDPHVTRAHAAARSALDEAASALVAAGLVARRAQDAGQETAGWHDLAALTALEAAAAALGDVTTRDEDRVRLAEALTTLVLRTRALEARAHELARRAGEDLLHVRALGEGLEERLAALGAPAAPRAADPAAAPRRALDRVREMLREALARTEKLVQESERTSSESLRAGESWSAARDEIDGLAARLVAPVPGHAPAGDGPGDDAGAMSAAELAADSSAGADDARPQRPLRVLGPDDLLPDDETWSHGGA